MMREQIKGYAKKFKVKRSKNRKNRDKKEDRKNK